MVREALRVAVVDNSTTDHWDQARLEWQIVGSEYDPEAGGTCVCGKQRIADQFTIDNPMTGMTLFPIGNECIKLFERSDFNERSQLHMDAKRSLRAQRLNDGALGLKSVSTRVIEASLRAGIISEWQCEFLTDMKGKRRPPTVKQEAKLVEALGQIAAGLESGIMALPSEPDDEGRP